MAEDQVKRDRVEPNTGFKGKALPQDAVIWVQTRDMKYDPAH